MARSSSASTSASVAAAAAAASPPPPPVTTSSAAGGSIVVSTQPRRGPPARLTLCAAPLRQVVGSMEFAECALDDYEWAALDEVEDKLGGEVGRLVRAIL